jgi:hypothetical protein
MLRLCAQQDGRFTVIPKSTAASALDPGDALAMFWERVSFQLLNDLSDAVLDKENCSSAAWRNRLWKNSASVMVSVARLHIGLR